MGIVEQVNSLRIPSRALLHKPKEHSDSFPLNSIDYSSFGASPHSVRKVVYSCSRNLWLCHFFATYHGMSDEIIGPTPKNALSELLRVTDVIFYTSLLSVTLI